MKQESNLEKPQGRRNGPKERPWGSIATPGIQQGDPFSLAQEECAFRRAVEESIIAGIAAFDTDGSQTYANPAFCKMVGWSQEELSGKEPPFVYWPGEERETNAKAFRKILEGEKPKGSLEIRLQRRNGERFNALLLYSALTDEQGHRRGWVVSASDFTQQKRAEEEMRRVNAELEERVRRRTDELDRLVRERTQDLRERIRELNCLCTVSGLLNEEEATPEDILQRMVDLIPSGWQFPEIACARAVLEEREYRTENFLETPWRQTSAITSQGRQVGILEVGYLEETPGPFLEEERTLLQALAGQMGEFLERKRVRDALKTSSRYTRSLIEASLDPLVTISPQGKITDVNRATELATGVARQKLIGSDFSDYFTEPQKAREGYEQVFQRGAVRDYPLAIRHVSGNVTDVLYNASVYRSGAGEVQGVFAAARDITERKQAEEALRQNEKFLRNILELLPVGVWITDPQGVITYGNPAAHRIWGESRDVGLVPFKEFKGWWLATGKPIEPEEWAVARAIRKGEASLNEEVEIECFDGSHKSILNSAIPLRNEKNEIIGAFIINDDITERRRTEQAVRQMQKMEALGTLAGGIAHDFNNLLMPIVINTELALLDVKKGILPSLTYMQLVKEAATRGQGLVKQIITFSRQREQPRQPVDINPVIKEALKFLRASIPKNIEIRSSLEVDPAVVLADPTQIHQVLMNLCSNAAFAMRGQRGLLQVTVTRVEMDPEAAAWQADLKPGAYLRLTVSDTGHGMDPEVRDRAFDPFFTTKKPGEGTGMGLAVVHGIIQNHEGAITLETEVGKGTTVHVFLPWVQADEPQEPVPSGPIPTGKERILLVDDEEIQVQTLQHMLERLGYRVIGKTSALEALEIFRSHPDVFDLVITDQTMPALTGAELSRELLRLRPDLPIILYTGYSETFDEEEARAIGIRDFAVKPMTVMGLAERIRNALKIERY